MTGRSPRRRALAPAAVLAAAGLALTACSGGGNADAAATPGSGGGAGSSASSAAGGSPKLTVTGAYMPQPVGDLAAGFLVVHNAGTGDDALTSVTSPLSDSVTIHKTVGNRMVEVKSFDVPPGGSLDLARGGNHIMLMGIAHPPKQGQSIELDLHFKRTGAIKVTVPVKAANYQPPATP
ncbi:copper chaperone PCu(A)C [Streptomyces fuscigenes]|uniref:copper chaperone PCu(A)C n=1 Tax=Streptomyces fuscigenes TaxID=1528880 RepID=UPI001F24AB96|nr:copper chaperone PCu(A)C [Streptomyces fuscigenes]MCF3965175.1 copper chaperone PCu(A)C [Streptomyces fuscigenes]